MFMISLAIPFSGLVNLLLCIAYFCFLRHRDRKTPLSEG